MNVRHEFYPLQVQLHGFKEYIPWLTVREIIADTEWVSGEELYFIGQGLFTKSLAP